MLRPARLQSAVFALPAISVALLVGGPSAAAAQGCTGAPGASAIQQYCEAVPRADGGSDRPGGGSGSAGGGSGSNGSGLSAGTSKALDQAGADGAAVERLTRGTISAASSPKATPKPKKGATGTLGASGPADDGAVLAERIEGPADPEGSPLKAATNAVSNGPTAGSGVVWGLAGVSVLGAAAAVFLRRRGDSLDLPDDES